MEVPNPLAVTAIEAATLDAVFPGPAHTSPEGTLTRLRPCTTGSLYRLVTSAPPQPAGAAVLTREYRHRRHPGV